MAIQKILTFSGILLKVTIAVGINFAFFSIISLTQSLFSKDNDDKKDKSNERKVLVEMIKPMKKEEKKTVQQRIRTVSQSSGEGKGATSKVVSKFFPDLDISGGDGAAIEQQGEMESVIFNEGEADEDAIPMNNPPPSFPSRARDLGIEGAVDISITIGTDGNVDNIEILSSPHPSFDEEIRKVISKWRFKPARNKGVPVKMKVKQTIEYKLDS